MAVIELARFGDFSDVDQTFLEQLSETLGVVLNAIIANQRTEQLLEQSQELTRELQERSEELQSQQEELRRSNAELEEQAQSLKASEELLQTQQEELRQTNEELQEKAALLSQQNRDIELQNREIELARQSLEEQARELALTSKYKSEFLANMCHELRTPLNSLLILSKLLSDNPDRNLTDKQIEFARTIHQAGSDLLALISDILDLSKVEAGKMEVHPAGAADDRRARLRRPRVPLGRRGEGPDVHASMLDDGAPASIVTDEQRLQQVLRNLLSNAFKFTEEGEVDLRIGPAPSRAVRGGLHGRATPASASREDKLRLIFEAFQQADSGTSRRYGGTGLGPVDLARDRRSCSAARSRSPRRRARAARSRCSLPAELAAPPVEPTRTTTADGARRRRPTAPSQRRSTSRRQPLQLEPPRRRRPPGAGAAATATDDREELVAGDRVLLVVAPPRTGRARRRRPRTAGFKVLARRGRARPAIGLAHEYGPDAVLLDLDAENGAARAPQAGAAHAAPAGARGRRRRTRARRALRCGAAQFVAARRRPPTRLDAALAELVAFLDRPMRHVLVVEDDDDERNAVGELVGGEGIDVTAGGLERRGARRARGPALRLHRARPQARPEGLGAGLRPAREGQGRRAPPRRAGDHPHRQGADPPRGDAPAALRRDSIIVKDAGSPERLLAETSLFLHRPESSLPDEDRRRLESMHQADSVLQGRTVLIVDDDVRNVFALTSALEARGMVVRFAENGREAIDQLKEDAEVDLVLMDVMMPEMDGYETTRAVRADARSSRACRSSP